jgi:hypothetical protein
LNVTIQIPGTNMTVGWSFTAGGTYDLGTTQPPGPADPSAGTITVTVYESDGTTPLSGTTVTPDPYPIPTGTTSGSWSAAVSHQANYNGAIIKAVLRPSAGGSAQASVSGINISQIIPPPPIPPIPPIPPVPPPPARK